MDDLDLLEETQEVIELEDVESEREDHEASLPTYEILTYPADYTLEVLVEKLKKKQIVVPSFQRRFVWSRVQSSKLIESFLLGLPVPSIFLYSDPRDNTLLVVDGQQRLRTIAYYFEGFFGEEEGGKRPVFRMTGLDEKSPFLNQSYEDLEASNPAAFNKLNDSVLRAFVIKQLNPADDTSIYHVFERLNTGGTFLHPQEIRNAIYRGGLNTLLWDLNENDQWRDVLGKPKPDKRQRDVELILRFLALFHDRQEYEKPMKNFLNTFMEANQEPTKDQAASFQSLFSETTKTIYEALGPRPFHIRAGLNAAVFDAVYTVTAHHLGDVPGNFPERFHALIHDEDFLGLVSSRTTNTDVVERRLAQADRILFS